VLPGIKRFECKPALLSDKINPKAQAYILVIKKIGSNKYHTLGYLEKRDDFEDGLKVIQNYIYHKWHVKVKINCIKYTIGKTKTKKLAKRNQYYKYRKITKYQVFSLNIHLIYRAIFLLMKEIEPNRFLDEFACIEEISPRTCNCLEHLSNLSRASDRFLAIKISDEVCDRGNTNES